MPTQNSMAYHFLVNKISDYLLESLRFSPEVIKDFKTNSDFTTEITNAQDKDITYTPGIEIMNNPRYLGDLLLSKGLRTVPNGAVVSVPKTNFPAKTFAAVSLQKRGRSPYDIKFAPSRYELTSSKSSSVSPGIDVITLRGPKLALDDLLIPKLLGHEIKHVDQIHNDEIDSASYDESPHKRIKIERDADASSFKLLRHLSKEVSDDDVRILLDGLRSGRNLNRIGKFDSSVARTFGRYLTDKEYNNTQGTLGNWAKEYHDKIKTEEL